MQLPVLPTPVDNTIQSAYMNCPREYHFGYVLHRREREVRAALSFGDIWHKLLESHYKTGADVVQVEEIVRKHVEGKPQPVGDYRTLERALMDYPKYMKQWPMGKDVASTVGFPDNPMVELTTSIEGSGLDHPYAGKIDRLFQEDGLVYVEDHKTTSRFDKNYFKQFELSNQMMGYTYIAQQLLPGQRVVGVRINCYHVLTEKTAFYRQPVTFSKGQLDGWVANFNKWIARIRLDYWAWQIQQGHEIPAIDDKIIDFLRTVDTFPAHFGDNGCSRKFGMCGYHRICSLPPRVQMKALEQDFDVLPWNPLDSGDED